VTTPTRLTEEQLADLAERKNQEFDGEAHLTNEELDALISMASELAKVEAERYELVAFIREYGEELDRWIAPDFDDEAGAKACGALRVMIERYTDVRFGGCPPSPSAPKCNSGKSTTDHVE